MPSVSLTGKDTTVMNSRIFSDFADGDVINLEFPNDIMAGKTGKDGNTIIAFNSTGKNVDATVRVLAGSADDKFLNSELIKYESDPASYVPLAAEFTKRVGDGNGNVNAINYKMDYGIPSKIPMGKDNQEGDTEQSVAIWNLKFYNVNRSIS